MTAEPMPGWEWEAEFIGDDKETGNYHVYAPVDPEDDEPAHIGTFYAAEYARRACVAVNAVGINPAAVPALLAVCKGLVKWLAYVPQSELTDEEYHAGMAALEAARAALALAETKP